MFELSNKTTDGGGHVISNTADSNGMTKKSLRAKLSNQICNLTSVPNLTNRRSEKKEVILARYGRGKVFGHCPYSLKEMKNCHPYTIKCVS